VVAPLLLLLPLLLPLLLVLLPAPLLLALLLLLLLLPLLLALLLVLLPLLLEVLLWSALALWDALAPTLSLPPPPPHATKVSAIMLMMAIRGRHDMSLVLP
jgi:hypothetical protein